jgi:hypothetical protein
LFDEKKQKVLGSCDAIIDKRFCLAHALAWLRLGQRDAAYRALVAALRSFDVTKNGTVRNHRKQDVCFSFVILQVLFSLVVLACAQLAVSAADTLKQEALAIDAKEASRQLKGKRKKNLSVFVKMFRMKSRSCLWRNVRWSCCDNTTSSKKTTTRNDGFIFFISSVRFLFFVSCVELVVVRRRIVISFLLLFLNCSKFTKTTNKKTKTKSNNFTFWHCQSFRCYF